MDINTKQIDEDIENIEKKIAEREVEIADSDLYDKVRYIAQTLGEKEQKYPATPGSWKIHYDLKIWSYSSGEISVRFIEETGKERYSVDKFELNVAERVREISTIKQEGETVYQAITKSISPPYQHIKFEIPFQVDEYNHGEWVSAIDELYDTAKSVEKQKTLDEQVKKLESLHSKAEGLGIRV